MAGAAALGIAAPAAQANTYTVTGTADGAVAPCGGTTCATLRDAIAAANANAGADTISLSGLTGTIHIASGQPPLTIMPADNSGKTTITGPGAGALTISGDVDLSGTFNAGDSQIFKITGVPSGSQPAGSVAISGLTLTHGYDTSAGSGGGAILDNDKSPLALTDVAITNSRSEATSGTGGGAVNSNGGLVLTRTTLTGNTATAQDGGAISSYSKYSLEVVDSTISGNSAASGGGAILQAFGQLLVRNSQITGNNTTAADGEGGAILCAPKYSLLIDDSTISGNTAYMGGGLALLGQLSAVSSLHNTTISGNRATRGAGIFLSNITRASQVTIDHSTVNANQGGAASFGGGVLIDGTIRGTVDLINSTISGNTAVTGAGVSVGSDHAGQILGSYNGSPIGAIKVDNSTIAGNTASTHGGGIYLNSYDYGSPAAKKSATITVSSTIVAGNTAAGAAQDLDRADNSTGGGVNSAFSLFQAPGDAPLASTATITGVDPQLGALADNGGPTKTMKPAGTSPVLDQGHAPTTAPQSGQTDQPGHARTIDTALANPAGGDGTDIGAVELDAASVVIPPTPAPPPPPAFTVSVRGVSIAGPVAPLLPAGSTKADCAISTGQLSSCVLEIRSTSAMRTATRAVPAGSLLASGEVTSAGAATLSTPVTLTPAGRSVLNGRPLGLDAAATAVGAAASPHTVTGKVHLLRGPAITLGLVKRSTKLVPAVLAQLDQVAVMLNGAKTVTCTAYTDRHGSARADKRLTSTVAKAACTRLRAKGLTATVTSIGRGHAVQVASNKTARGRAANRRLVIAFTF